MKISTLVVASAALMVSISSSAQDLLPKHSFRKCGTVEAMEEARKKNPNIETSAQFENWLQSLIQQRSASRTNTAYNLPVVFHVVNNGEAEGSGLNLAYSFIKSQLNQINKDFANKSNSPYAVAANTEIQFSLAQYDPNGVALAQPGVDRVNRNTKGWSSPGTSGWSMNYIIANIKPQSIWDPTRYVNIWLAPMSGGTLGFATFPTSSGLTGLSGGEDNSTAGVVIATSSVGSVVNPSTANCSANPYNLGKTMTHELGHFFGLRHIWGDVNCGTDYVDDTPVHQDQNAGKPAHPKPNGCGTPDEMFENYMDYTDDGVLNTFTAGQVARMQTVMANSPRRSELVTSTAGLVAAPSNLISFTACANTLDVSEKGIGVSFPYYRDIQVVVNVEDKATGAATLTINTGGTALNNVDYQLLTPSVTFAAGDAYKVINLRILDDAVPEPDKTITISYSVSGIGVSPATVNQTFTINLLDDDNVRPGENRITLLSESFGNFGGVMPTGWNSLTDGGPNSFVVSTNGNAGGTGQAAHITNNVNTKPNTYTKTTAALAVLRTPLIDASGLSNLTLEHKYRVAGETTSQAAWDYATIVSASATAPTSFVDVPSANVLVSNTPVSGINTLNLPATFNSSKFYLGVWWENDNSSGTDPGINVDDVVLTADGTRIETAAGTSNSFAVSPSTINNFKSRANDRLIATVSNVSTSLSQLTVSIIEAGTDRPTITTESGTYLRSRKVFQVTPPTANNTTTYSATFYFTPGEVAQWGAGISSVKILKLSNSANLSGLLSPSDGVVVTPTVNDRLTTDGYISFTANFTGFSKFVIVEANTTLPVRLLDFTGTLSGNKVKLNWKTTAETNNRGFDVERSLEGTSFTKLGWVNATNGNAENKYSFDDATIAKGNRYFYRLKQVDIDGRYTYSPVVNIAYLAGQLVQWYPNPVKDVLVINNAGAAKNTTVVITDVSGKLMYRSQSLFNGKLEVHTANWSSGVYNVQVTIDNEPLTFKVVKY